jgi:hypothetical protein
VKLGSGAHTVSHLMDSGALFLRVKRMELEADHLPYLLSNLRIKLIEQYLGESEWTI